MKKIMLSFVAILCIFSFTANALTTKEYQFKSDHLILRGKQTRLYIFYNPTRYTIILDRKMKKDPGASAGWASGLGPGRYSALLMHFPSFTIDCIYQDKTPQYRPIACRKVLIVRPIKKFILLKKSWQQTSAWITENQNCQSLQKTLRQRGINTSFHCL